ncbi:MAG: septum formation family protein [Marmoricola sp.]
MSSARALKALLVCTILVVVSACGTAAPPKAVKKTPPPPPPAPIVGTCRTLTFSAAAAPSDDTPTVPCTEKHTAVTVAVGTLVSRARLKTLDINSAAVQQLLAVNCPKAVEAYAGGSGRTFDLSQIQALPFVPTPAQIAKGANWYRCDMVVLAAPSTLATVTGTMRHALSSARALDRWGTCGTAAPSARTFKRVLCSQRHTWRAVALINIPKKASYLSKNTSRAASLACRKIAAKAAHGALKYSWSFEWPNKQQWTAGQRFGLCWLPRAH